MPNFQLKKKILSWLDNNNQKMIIGSMFFRPYNPLTDNITEQYSTTDWNLIFEGYTEDDMRELQECANVIILLWCDVASAKPHGMLYLEEPHDHLGELLFHGGTWDHSPNFFIRIYHSLVTLFQMLLDIGAKIKTTCGIDNNRADKFQKSLGFVEYMRDDRLSYKMLDKKKFEESPITMRIKCQDF